MSKMKVYLVDNPGFGETNKQANMVAQIAMTSSSLYVLCMDCRRTEGKILKEFIKQFFTKNNGKYMFYHNVYTCDHGARDNVYLR